MERVADDGARFPHLHEAATAHDRYAIGDVIDDGQVMADEQIGQVEIPFQILKQVEDLRLYRDVERRCRFVAQDELRIKRKGARDADALALPTGEGMRIAAQEPRVETNQAHQVADPFRALLLRPDPVHFKRLQQRVVDGHARIERGERVLEDELNPAAVIHKVRALEIGDVFQSLAAIVENLATLDAERAQYGFRGSGLAGSGLAHEAKTFAAADRQADVVERGHGPGPGAQERPLAQRKLLGDIAHLDQRLTRCDIAMRPVAGQVFGLQLDRANGDEALVLVHVETRDRIQERFEVVVLRV